MSQLDSKTTNVVDKLLKYGVQLRNLVFTKDANIPSKKQLSDLLVDVLWLDRQKGAYYLNAKSLEYQLPNSVLPHVPLLINEKVFVR